MATSKPHYLLFCDGCLLPSGALHTEARGRWRFVLEDIVTGIKTEASDCEASDHVDRVSLLAVTRGLEALEQPSRVTLVTTSRYVARGLQYGLVEWRENDYCWEHFGSIQPIRNADLWRRVDVALRFHEVQCRWMSQESPLREESALAMESTGSSEQTRTASILAAEFAREDNDCVVIASTDVAVGNEVPLLESAVRTTPLSCADRDEDVASNDVSQYIPQKTLKLRLPEAALLSDRMSTTLEDSPSRITERRLLNAKVNRPLRWIWNTILAIDAFLVSCLRCLFLLDPRREHFRRRNY